jgi:ABC-2 type transport system permease protein
MSTLVATELLKLRTTRTARRLLAVALALTCARLWLVVRGLGTVDAATSGSDEATMTVLGAAGTGTLVVVLAGVLAVTGEYRHQTVTATFLRTPHRPRVLAAKATASALAGMAAAGALLATSAAVGVAAGAVDPSVLASALVPVVPGFLLGSALYGLLGVGIGALIGNQTVAVVVPLLWFVVLEQLMPSYGLGWLVPWTPGGASAALVGASSSGVLPTWVGGLLLAGYGLALTVAGARRIARADIT